MNTVDMSLSRCSNGKEGVEGVDIAFD